jgi:hypothetical protein
MTEQPMQDDLVERVKAAIEAVDAEEVFGGERLYFGGHDLLDWEREVVARAAIAILQKDLAARDAEIARMKSEPQNTCEMPEVAAMRYIEQLRSGIGASVTILCDNDDATYKDQSVAIEICDDWTDWKDRRFYGESVLQCLANAMIARAAYRKAMS